MDDSLALQQAITIWTSGTDIDLVLETELMMQGLDVPALRNKYMEY